MKKFIIVFLTLLISGITGFAQNRIHAWDVEKITSIRVEFTSPEDETEILLFDTRQDMDTILSFLKNVEFRELNGNRIDTEEETKNGSCKIVFQGQRDQVYLFSHSAFIGKTTFLIDTGVLGAFRILVEAL
jgi:hypothetical protein